MEAAKAQNLSGKASAETPSRSLPPKVASLQRPPRASSKSPLSGFTTREPRVARAVTHPAASPTPWLGPVEGDGPRPHPTLLPLASPLLPAPGVSQPRANGAAAAATCILVFSGGRRAAHLRAPPSRRRGRRGLQAPHLARRSRRAPHLAARSSSSCTWRRTASSPGTRGAFSNAPGPARSVSATRTGSSHLSRAGSEAQEADS